MSSNVLCLEESVLLNHRTLSLPLSIPLPLSHFISRCLSGCLWVLIEAYFGDVIKCFMFGRISFAQSSHSLSLSTSLFIPPAPLSLPLSISPYHSLSILHGDFLILCGRSDTKAVKMKHQKKYERHWVPASLYVTQEGESQSHSIMGPFQQPRNINKN